MNSKTKQGYLAFTRDVVCAMECCYLKQAHHCVTQLRLCQAHVNASKAFVLSVEASQQRADSRCCGVGAAGRGTWCSSSSCSSSSAAAAPCPRCRRCSALAASQLCYCLCHRLYVATISVCTGTTTSATAAAAAAPCGWGLGRRGCGVRETRTVSTKEAAVTCAVHSHVYLCCLHCS